jgi:Sulfotransferase family
MSALLDYVSINSAVAALRKKQIFFIGGAVKSGTTWLQLLLDAHPDVSCNGEGHFIENGLAQLLRDALERHRQLIFKKNRSIFQELQGYPCLSNDDYHYLLASCISLYLLRQSRAKLAAHSVGERTPDNVRSFDLLHTLFPDAKFLHIVRDGRDCAVSGWFHNLRVSPDWVKRNFGSVETYTIKHADYWAKQLTAAQAFADKHCDRVCQIRYEDLAANIEQTLARIFGFLNVAAEQSVLAQCRTAASFESLSGGRAAGQENLNSFFRKGIAGDWRNHLSEEANSAFRKHAGDWLDRFGYS